MLRITQMLEARGFTVDKETSIQATAHNARVRVLINKEDDGTRRVSSKASIGGWCGPVTVANDDALGEYLDQRKFR